MKKASFHGHLPKDRNYKYLMTINDNGRDWYVFVNTKKGYPHFIHWKVFLNGSGESKANYWICYSVNLKRIVLDEDGKRFMEDFFLETANMIEDISMYLTENYNKEQKKDGKEQSL